MFLKIFVFWVVSAVFAYFIAALSISSTIINIVLWLIAISLITALILGANKKTKSALLAAILPAPLLIAGLLILPTVSYLIMPLLEREPFFTACKNVGVEYFAKPEEPVHSVAYDWDGNYDPGSNTYKLNRFGRVAELNQAERSRIDNDVLFTERRIGNNYGAVVGESSKYIRQVYRGDPGSKVNDLTADILITYRLSPQQELGKAGVNRGPISHEISVTDRRNGKLIAVLRYVFDQKNMRLCGPIINNVLSEDEFLVKAVY